MSKDSLTPALPETGPAAPVISVRNLNFYYGKQQILKDINLNIFPNEITAIIGPSGCGKTTLLRFFNRMNEIDLNSSHPRREGSITLDGKNIDLIEIEELRGLLASMVFQKPNPFPKSIYDNVAFGPKIWGGKSKSEIDSIVESSLKEAALWEEVRQRLKDSALNLSLGQQQRLCLARVLALKPEAILLDESTASLDPNATWEIEELLVKLKKNMIIIVVTHNMDQGKRIGDTIVFMCKDRNGPENGPGEIRGYISRSDINREQRMTEEMAAYLEGRFG